MAVQTNPQLGAANVQVLAHTKRYSYERTEVADGSHFGPRIARSSARVQRRAVRLKSTVGGGPHA
jgi:hypothetical protein